jgi:hypothetical protein
MSDRSKQREIKRKIQEKSRLTSQQINRKAHTIRGKHDVGTNIALGILAKECGIPITKHFDQTDLDLINARISTKAVPRSQSVRKAGTATTRKEPEYSHLCNDKLILPEMSKKIKIMKEAYVFMFIIENSLRGFIRAVMKRDYGPRWWEDCVKSQIKDIVERRKKREKHNPWSGRRGSHGIFYCDMDNLRNIIRANPKYFDHLFKNVTGNIHWLLSKIAEVTHIRNAIAHNCLIRSSDCKMLLLYCEYFSQQLPLLLEPQV